MLCYIVCGVSGRTPWPLTSGNMCIPFGFGLFFLFVCFVFFHWQLWTPWNTYLRLNPGLWSSNVKSYAEYYCCPRTLTPGDHVAELTYNSRGMLQWPFPLFVLEKPQIRLSIFSQMRWKKLSCCQLLVRANPAICTSVIWNTTFGSFCWT